MIVIHEIEKVKVTIKNRDWTEGKAMGGVYAMQKAKLTAFKALLGLGRACKNAC